MVATHVQDFKLRPLGQIFFATKSSIFLGFMYSKISVAMIGLLHCRSYGTLVFHVTRTYVRTGSEMLTLEKTLLKSCKMSGLIFK